MLEIFRRSRCVNSRKPEIIREAYYRRAGTISIKKYARTRRLNYQDRKGLALVTINRSVDSRIHYSVVPSSI